MTGKETTHSHEAIAAEPERRELVKSLKRKAVEQQLTVTQNLITEVLASASPEVNRILPDEVETQ